MYFAPDAVSIWCVYFDWYSRFTSIYPHTIAPAPELCNFLMNTFDCRVTPEEMAQSDD